MIDQWVVYFNPSDYPGKWVVRKFTIVAGRIEASDALHVCSSCSEARENIPLGLACIPRHAQDEPHIVEAWI